MAGDQRLGWRQRRTLRTQVAAERRPWCQHPQCKHPNIPIDYAAPPHTRYAFDLDEIVARCDGGDPLDYRNVRATHATCNRAAGARIANSKRTRDAMLIDDDW